jgi:hypothetical protein
MKYRIVLFLSCIILASCSDEALWDTGPMETKRFDLEDYDIIEMNSIFNVTLVQDSLNFATITCGGNIIEDVKIIQNENVIKLSQKRIRILTRSYEHTRAELHFKNLYAVVINNSVKIETSSVLKVPALIVIDNGELSELDLDVDCHDFNMSVSKNNMGCYRISGSAENSNLLLNGSAHFRTENLVVDSCSFVHNGIGDCYVNAHRILTGKLSGTGSLYYRYYPGLKAEIENSNGRIFATSR